MIALPLCTLLQDGSFEERKLSTRREGTAQTDSWFSPDGKKVAFGATVGRELWWKVIPVD